MKIAVCIKQVPTREWQPRLNDTGRWIREQDASFEMNEPDAYALEEALRLREKHGGEVVVCSAGPARVQTVLREALGQMDQWLTALAKDTSNDAAIVRIRRARPAELVDACWTKDQTPKKVVEKQQYLTGQCNDIYPSHSFPRYVAGAGIANDVIKCQLRPVSASDYKVPFTPEEMTRLKKIFSGGVCDWSKPSVDWQALGGTWQNFSVQRGTN